MAFAAKTRLLSSAEVVARMDREGVPCGKVNSLDEVIEDPRVQHAHSLIEYDHPGAGACARRGRRRSSPVNPARSGAMRPRSASTPTRC